MKLSIHVLLLQKVWSTIDNELYCLILFSIRGYNELLGIKDMNILIDV
jgi:hypothetical protein